MLTDLTVVLIEPAAEVIMLIFAPSKPPLKVIGLILHVTYPRFIVIRFLDDLLLLFLKVVHAFPDVLMVVHPFLEVDHPFLKVLTIRLIHLVLQRLLKALYALFERRGFLRCHNYLFCCGPYWP